MFDVEVLSKHIEERHEIELFGKKYAVKNCVRIVEKEVVKVCAVLVSDSSEISVFIDLKEYNRKVF